MENEEKKLKIEKPEDKKSFDDSHKDQTQKSLTNDEIMWIFREIRV